MPCNSTLSNNPNLAQTAWQVHYISNKKHIYGKNQQTFNCHLYLSGCPKFLRHVSWESPQHFDKHSVMSSGLFGKNIKQERRGVDERLVNKHVNTLACLQETAKENDLLRHRVSELEGYKLRTDYYGALEKQVQSLQVQSL